VGQAAYLHLLEALDELARHCTHICSPVAFDLRNVRQTTHREPAHTEQAQNHV
jgi:hypothetical protein